MRTAMTALKTWGFSASTTYNGRALTASERIMCAGPPKTYYPQYEIKIGGHKVKTTSTIPSRDVHALRDSIVLRGTLASNDALHFGILREIRLFRAAGVPVPIDDLTHAEIIAQFDQPVLLLV